MKKTFVSIVLFSAALFLSAAEPAKAPAEMTFWQMMSRAFDPAKMQEIRTAKLVYSATSQEGPDAFMILRARKKGFIRFDIVTKDEHYIACQNGNEYWAYNKKDGVSVLDQDGIREMKEDLSFLPVPFYVSPEFTKLTYVGDGQFRSTKCDRYKVNTVSPLSMEVWVDKETGLLCKVKSSDDVGKYASAYRDYRDFDGIKIASTMHVSGPQGSMMLTLRSADWDTKFPETLFLKGSVIDDNTVALFQKELADNAATAKALRDAKKVRTAEVKQQQAEVKAKQTEAKAKRQADIQRRNNQRAIEKLEREIRVLEIEIADKTERLKKVESFAISSRDQAAAAAVGGSSRGKYTAWHYGGWGYTRSTGHSGERRAARKLGKAAAEAIDEYNELSQQLTEKKIQLSDAKAALAKLKKQQQ